MMLSQTLDFTGVINFDASPSGLSAKLGNRISDNLAVEGVFGIGMGDDNYASVPGASLDGKLKSVLGVNMLGLLPLSGSSEIYGKIGFAKIDVEISGSASGIGSASESYDDTGVSWGFGIKAGINNNSGIVLEYVQYPEVDLGDGDNIKTKTVNIGYQTKF